MHQQASLKFPALAMSAGPMLRCSLLRDRPPCLEHGTFFCEIAVQVYTISDAVA